MKFFTIFIFFYLPMHVSGQVSFTKSNLPIIIINTYGAEIKDEPKIKADMGIINNGPDKENKITDLPNDYNGKIGIEYRGSTSLWFPKKPYGFETRDDKGDNNDVKLLGMPKESDWTLNTTYNDKSLMRDALSYILAGSFMEYAPRVRYNELVLNGRYQGIYLMVEKIKRGKNRVNISKMETTDNNDDALTGGYIIKIDKDSGNNSGDGWNSLYAPYPGASQKTYFQYEYPKVSNITYQQKNYIRQHMNTVENSIASTNYKDPVNGYRKYIDNQSLMDYIIINELSKNPDAYRLSTFFYKQRDSEGGNIKFGPAWDFNLGFGNVDYCTQGNAEGLVILNFNDVCPSDGWVIHFWWKKFLQDEMFYNDLKYRWKILRQNQLSNDRINFILDSLSTLLAQAQVRNFQQWPVLGQYVWPNYFVGNTYNEEVFYLKGWLKNRLTYLDKVWAIIESNGMDTDYFAMVLAPNPVHDNFNINFRSSVSQSLVLNIYNYAGHQVPFTSSQKDKNSVEIDVSRLPAGLYILKAEDNQHQKIIKFIKQ